MCTAGTGTRGRGDRLLVTIGDAAPVDLPLPALAGRHQIDNAGLAVACALALGDLAPDARRSPRACARRSGRRGCSA